MSYQQPSLQASPIHHWIPYRFRPLSPPSMLENIESSNPAFSDEKANTNTSMASTDCEKEACWCEPLDSHIMSDPSHMTDYNNNRILLEGIRWLVARPNIRFIAQSGISLCHGLETCSFKFCDDFAIKIYMFKSIDQYNSQLQSTKF